MLERATEGHRGGETSSMRPEGDSQGLLGACHVGVRKWNERLLLGDIPSTGASRIMLGVREAAERLPFSAPPLERWERRR